MSVGEVSVPPPIGEDPSFGGFRRARNQKGYWFLTTTSTNGPKLHSLTPAFHETSKIDSAWTQLRMSAFRFILLSLPRSILSTSNQINSYRIYMIFFIDWWSSFGFKDRAFYYEEKGRYMCCGLRRTTV